MKDQENDTDNFKKVEEAIYSYPLPLLSIKNESIIKSIDEYLPYSVGMEFECFKKPSYKEIDFFTIPDIMDISTDSSEQRYRIPSGLKGLVCLYNISQALKKNSELDLSSSNHYHTDMTDVWEVLMKDEPPDDPTSLKPTREMFKEYIISELEKWGTAKDKSMSHGWHKFNSLKTLEIRIGEPTFEYNIIVKRLIQCAKITKYIKDQLTKTDEEKRLMRLSIDLMNLESEENKSSEDINDIKSKIKQRTNKIK